MINHKNLDALFKFEGYQNEQIVFAGIVISGYALYRMCYGTLF
jgi:hypothetical protein